MTYTEFIESIPRGRLLEYKERHHIIPRCLGGSDDSENLIDLTPREHFIAHRLLAIENPEEEKLAYAFHMMSIDGRHEISPEEYEEARVMHSNNMRGNSLHTIPHTIDTRKKISESTKAALSRPEVYKKLVESHQNPSDEFKRRIAESQLGRKASEETKQKMSISHVGKKYKPMSDEGRKNISEGHKGRMYSFHLKCRVCGTIFIGDNPGIRRCNNCKSLREL